MSGVAALLGALVVVLLCHPSAGAVGETTDDRAPDTPAAPPASRIIGEALVSNRAWPRLAWLSDRIGHRLSGSEALERAVRWAAEEWSRDGLDRVWTESVMVPHWERGAERARIVAPVEWEMALLGLGGTVATAEGGIEAEVVEVDSLEALAALGRAVEGRIVLFNRPMARGFRAENGYSSVAPLRVDGPSAAARQGAVATLVRSLGTADFRLPHTGTLDYDDDAPRIPAAAIAAEDAAMLSRLLESGDAVRVRLELGARRLPDAESANVLGEIRGRERPEEVVLIGAHLDSWDVGHGAHDDGAGCVVVMEALALLARLDAAPRRTIRGVLFTNEENGLRGGRDYAARHGAETHVAAIEMDGGAFAPIGFGITAGDGAVERLGELLAPLCVIGAAGAFSGGGGADIGPLKEMGVPQIGLWVDSDRYFDYHHTAADTLDKVDPRELSENVAAMAWAAWALAESESTLPRLPPPEPSAD